MLTIASDRNTDMSGVHFKAHPKENQPEIDKIIKTYEYSLQSQPSLQRPSILVQEAPPKQTKERTILRYGPLIFVEECVDKLIILRTMMKEKVDAKWYRKIEYRAPEVRFTAEDDEDYALYRFTNTRKLTKDICIVHNILNIALEGLERFNGIKEFLKAISVLEKEHEDVMELCNSFEHNLHLLEQLNFEMGDSFKKNQQKYNKTLDVIYRLGHAYEDLVLYSKIEQKYVNKWEDDRCYLNDFLNNGRVNDLRNMIQEYQHNIDCENRINLEICKFLEETTNTHNDNIEKWMTDYDKELERYEGELFEVKVDREKWETEFGLLKKEYESRCEEMTRWLEFKEEMKKQLELELLRAAVATKIQAWWRGIMVRRHLGPYRKKKKGKKDKNKKGKKKK